MSGRISPNVETEPRAMPYMHVAQMQVYERPPRFEEVEDDFDEIRSVLDPEDTDRLGVQLKWP